MPDMFGVMKIHMWYFNQEVNKDFLYMFGLYSTRMRYLGLSFFRIDWPTRTDIPLHSMINMCFMHDGAPAHLAIIAV